MCERAWIHVKADVSKDAQARKMVEKVANELGRIDILVNNAGTTDFVKPEDLEGLTEEMWDSAMAVNVKGTFFCSRAVVPIMKRQGGGAIINTASIAGITGIGSSIVSVGGGVNAVNICRCIEYLQQTKWDGAVSIECHGSDENTAASVKFMRKLVKHKRAPLSSRKR